MTTDTTDPRTQLGAHSHRHYWQVERAPQPLPARRLDIRRALTWLCALLACAAFWGTVAGVVVVWRPW